MKKILISLLLLLLAWSAVKTVHSEKGTQNNETLQKINSKKIDINQEVMNSYRNITELEPPHTLKEITLETPVLATPKPAPRINTPQAWPKERAIQRIREVFGHNADKAINIASCESGLISNRISGVDRNPGSYGLFQIRGLTGRGSIEQLLDGEYNIQMAYKISGKGETWSKAWVNCARKYNYK